MTVKRKIGPFWIKIPCDHALNVGSCYYVDVCALSPYKHTSTCPSIFTENHLPCKCPVIAVSTIQLQLHLTFYEPSTLLKI